MDIRIVSIYQSLSQYYGELNWWPGESIYEIMVGAILTQNTNWKNVELALANFQGDVNPDRIAHMDLDQLKVIIRPAGFFNQKAQYLKNLTAWYKKYDYNPNLVCKHPLAKVRKELLSIKGVGPETADDILLYAFSYPTFVVDAYTKRLCNRYPIPAGHTYHQIKAYFEENINFYLYDKNIFEGINPTDDALILLYTQYHALIVAHAKSHCRKKPLCPTCPLKKICKYPVKAIISP